MTASCLPHAAPAGAPSRPGLLARLLAMYLQPTMRELDRDTLRDIGAPDALQADAEAEAEVRAAWHRWQPPGGPFRDY